MRNYYLTAIIQVCVLMSSSFLSIAQTSLTPGTVGEINSPAGVFSGDVDMDGDLDVIAGSGVNGLILWKNEGGNPATWTKQTVDNNTGQCLSAFVADIVRDGQPDIVALSTDRNQIVYYKNKGGDPIVWEKQIISTAVSEPHEIYVCDFDQDGNQDVLAACMGGAGEVIWWHNNGGDPALWTKQVIDSNAPGVRSAHAGDIDGDGDMDVAAAIFASDDLAWYRNDGGNPIKWTKFLASDSFDGSHRVQIADMDNDGDLDLLGTAYMANEIAIWKNDDGAGMNWTKISVDNSFVGAVIGIAADVNSDGHMDIFGTAQESNVVAWYENKGTGELSYKKRIIDDFDGVWPACAGDIDNDLDIDFVAGGFDANEVRWYENKQVGRFTNRIEINETPTNLGFFVPEEYNPEEEYKLIVALHICGDENEYSRYRDNLIPLCLELNAILVAPDCHNTINNLVIPEPEFITGAIEYTRARFNIDEDHVYLTGGSCNGRTVLKYGLEKIFDFRGVIPFNPYLPDLPNGFYDFTSDMPVCFGVGTLDPSFSNAQTAYNNLMSNQAKAGFITMPGVAHEFYIPEFTETMFECIAFIDSLTENSTSVNDFKKEENGFKCFPNPFHDHLSLQLPDAFLGPVEITIHNLMGQEIYRNKINADGNPGHIIDLKLAHHSIPKGTYILRLSKNEQISMGKIIKN